MSGTTISTAITVGVTLTAASQNPVLVTRTGSIYSTDGYNALSLGPGVDWSVTNLGSITGNGYATELGTAVSGIDFLGSGSVTNGSATDTTADITGSYGILFENSAGTVTNFGTIGNPTPDSTNFAAVMFEHGGTVINGSLVDKSAAIEAGINGATLVENFGSMTMFSDYSGGVFVTTGTVLNGSVTDTTASIFAITYGAAVTVYGNGNMASGGPSSSITNFGSILNYQGDGVEAGSGVTLINGSDSDRTAQIDTGSYLGDAVELQGTNATVKNFGKITVDLGNSADAIFVGGVSSGYGAVATATIVNGDSLDTTALISGREAGIAGPTSPGELPAVITVVNFGTIEGAIGIDLAHLSLFNVSSTGVVTNAGTIASTDGAGGVAIQFGEGAERLIVDPGAVFVGSVIGGTGENVLELAAGTGTIGGLATTDDASAQFQGFDKTVVDASGTWSLTGNNTMGLLVDNGALTLQAGTTLDVQSMLTGTSGITMTAGDTIEVAAAAAQSPSITFLTGDALVLPYAQGFGTGTGTSAYAGPLLQDFAHSDAIDLLNFAPTSITGLAYDPASGLLQVQQGSKTVADLTFKLDGSLGANAFQFGTDGRSVPGTLITLR